MVWELATSLLLIFAGFLGMIWLLLFWFGDEHTRPIVPYGPESLDEGPASESSDPSFIPMPGHLKTNDEMVAWMTKELPKLMGEIPKPRV